MITIKLNGHDKRSLEALHEILNLGFLAFYNSDKCNGECETCQIYKACNDVSSACSFLEKILQK